MDRIIVLGTGYSGSGAVLAYLRGRSDFVDPFRGKELQISRMPHGLMALHAACGTAFHGASAHEQIECFIRETNAYARESGWLWFGKNYDRLIPGFTQKRDAFISEIVACRYPFRFEYLRMRTPKVWQFLGAVVRRLGFSGSKVFKRELAYLPVIEADFIGAARRFTDSLLDEWEADDQKAIVLNQAGSGWNPVDSTQYFRRRKVITVLRDPRDQFFELRKFKGFDDVVAFCRWYRNMRARLNNVLDRDQVLLMVQYEDFVLNHQDCVQAVCRHIGREPAVPSTYIAAQSRKNIGQFRQLNKVERISIERECAEFIYPIAGDD